MSFQAGNQAFLAQMQQVRRNWQASGGMIAGNQALQQQSLQTFQAQSTARQPFRTVVPAQEVQNRGVLFTGAVQTATPAAPLARMTPRLQPAVRPVAFKRCSSCS